MVESGQLDEGPLPASEVQGVASRSGVNKTRFWVEPTSCMSYVAVNNGSALLRGNAPMRRALNWALDRAAYASDAGAYSRTIWTHLLPPGFPGSVSTPRLQPYAHRDIARARRLAAGHFRDGKITVFYRSSGTIRPAQAEVVRRDLIDLGVAPGNITMRGFSGADIYTAFAVRGSPADLAVSLGACNDLPPRDPGSAFIPFGLGLPWFPDNQKYRNKIAAADALKGNARLKAFGRLDLEITKKVAPLAVMGAYNNRFFFSNRVDPRSLVYHKVYADWSIPALALK